MNKEVVKIHIRLVYILHILKDITHSINNRHCFG